VSQTACRPAPTETREIGAKPSDIAAHSKLCNFARDGRENQPANCIDYSQADDYCKFVGGRVPSEEEWEYAARGSDGRKFPWGNEVDSKKVNLNATDTQEVAQFAAGASPFGALDMAGNVSEWTSSKYSRSYQPNAPKDAKMLVVRGGSWRTDKLEDGRVTRRDFASPDERYNTVGFRCAVDITPKN
jgi:formylglycine-generating enzyme required for sulfatase activity